MRGTGRAPARKHEATVPYPGSLYHPRTVAGTYTHEFSFCALKT
jgi:hypothetical protein